MLYQQVSKKYRPIPFWSWNEKLEESETRRQIGQMDEAGIGGYFMHARGGLKTEYLGEKWFQCVDACAKRAKELGYDAIHDTVHEMAKDEARHGRGFDGLLARYFA